MCVIYFEKSWPQGSRHNQKTWEARVMKHALLIAATLAASVAAPATAQMTSEANVDIKVFSKPLPDGTNKVGLLTITSVDVIATDAQLQQLRQELAFLSGSDRPLILVPRACDSDVQKYDSSANTLQHKINEKRLRDQRAYGRQRRDIFVPGMLRISRTF